MSDCISGWVMGNAEAVAIADVFADPRIPHDVYRRTFVRSLAMVPVRREEPVAAIGAYWATRHEATEEELAVLEALANASSLALANVELYQDLQRAVAREREARQTADAATGLEERSRRLVEAEAWQRRLIDSIADAIVVVDADGSVKFTNPAAERLFGRTQRELLGEHFGLPLVTGKTTEVDLQGGRVAEMRVVDLKWNGEPAWLASLRDITDRRHAEQTARQLWQERTARDVAERERERLQDLLARAPAAILTTRGREHRCVFANPGMERLIGFACHDGRPLRQSLAHLVGQGFLEGFERTFLEGRGSSQSGLPLRFHTPQGETERFVDITWEPLPGNDGVDGVMCFAYDVTEQISMHRDLEKAMERLREEDRRKDQFLAVLGHELRNPLAGIASGLSLIEQDLGRERRDWAVGMMRRQISLLTALLDDLLDVSAIARGKLQLERRTVLLPEVVDTAVAAVAARFEKRNQVLSVSAKDRLAVDADPSRLGQVLANLLVNASKYSDPGSRVMLRVRREGGEAVIEVEDHGQGIEAEMLDRIFDPFVQGRRGSSPATGGLGIGLTLVRQLVELHGGSVSATSDGPGAGSTFAIRLPLAAVDVTVQPAAAAGDSEPAPSAGDPGTLLLVDDNQDAAHALAATLELRGWRVAIAASGGEGLAQARLLRPDAILLDLDLPDLSGYEVATRLRREPVLADKLIVAISGFGDEQARNRSRRSGIDHHLAKPVDLDRLLALLK